MKSLQKVGKVSITDGNKLFSLLKVVNQKEGICLASTKKGESFTIMRRVDKKIKSSSYSLKTNYERLGWFTLKFWQPSFKKYKDNKINVSVSKTTNEIYLKHLFRSMLNEFKWKKSIRNSKDFKFTIELFFSPDPDDLYPYKIHLSESSQNESLEYESIEYEESYRLNFKNYSNIELYYQFVVDFQHFINSFNFFSTIGSNLPSYFIYNGEKKELDLSLGLNDRRQAHFKLKDGFGLIESNFPLEREGINYEGYKVISILYLINILQSINENKEQIHLSFDVNTPLKIYSKVCEFNSDFVYYTNYISSDSKMSHPTFIRVKREAKSLKERLIRNKTLGIYLSEEEEIKDLIKRLEKFDPNDYSKKKKAQKINRFEEEFESIQNNVESKLTPLKKKIKNLYMFRF